MRSKKPNVDFINNIVLQKAINEYRDDFMKLHINFQALRSGLIIKRCNKVFYSDNELEYYNRNMIEDLTRNYSILFDKYITSKHPHLEDMKDTLDPYKLAVMLGEPW